jgi:hypothetical protein
MGQPIPAQHPSVVLRSHFKLVRTLLAMAIAAVLALTAVVVILANDDNQISSAGKAPAVQQSQTPPGTRYDGGPEEGTRAISPPAPQVAPPPSSIASKAGPAYQSLRSAGSRYDGGPEEGTRGPVHTQFKQRAGGPTNLQGGPGAR